MLIFLVQIILFCLEQIHMYKEKQQGKTTHAMAPTIVLAIRVANKVVRHTFTSSSAKFQKTVKTVKTTKPTKQIKTKRSPVAKMWAKKFGL